MSSIRDFVPLQKLGQGSYSNVYKVRRNNDQQIYALKKVKMNSLSQKQKQNSLNQVRILASLQCQNIVAYKQAFFDQNLNVLCVVMEYADGGDLQKYIQSFIKNYKMIPEQQIWKAAEHITKGLNHLHKKGILHRDIKCANIFKNKSIYKLGDLNVSKVNGDKMAYTQTGTPYYASPQVWRDEPYDLKSDIWSFGCIIYEMAALKTPFNGKDMQELFKNIQKCKIQPLSAHYSNQLVNFIESCLQKDPKKRPNTDQVLKKIQVALNKKSSLQIKVNNPQNKGNQLLKTIKVPNDLKKLNQALPNSKYKKTVTLENNSIQIQKKNSHSTKQNKSCFLLQNKSQINGLINIKRQVQNIGISSNLRHQVSHNMKNYQKNYVQDQQIKISSQKILSQKIELILDPNSYQSPRNKIQNSQLFKSPNSEVRLSKKVQSGLGYSDRYQKSDRKPSTSSKVQRLNRVIDLDNSIKQITQRLKKPISMPRTQKKSNLINNSYLMDNSYKKLQIVQDSILINNVGKYNSSNQYQSGSNKLSKNYSNKYEILEQVRNKLVKKTRILSNNLSKPSYW